MRRTRINMFFCAAAAIMTVSAATPRTSLASASGTGAGLPRPAPASLTVEIDGRFVTVELSVDRTSGGAPIDPFIPVTTAKVTISIHDGAQLPNDLRVVGVRFEKLRGVNRFFFTPVSELPPAAVGFEIVQKDYHGDMPDRRTVQYLRAVVRLETDTEVIKVPMGIVHVTTLILP